MTTMSHNFFKNIDDYSQNGLKTDFEGIFLFSAIRELMKYLIILSAMHHSM